MLKIKNTNLGAGLIVGGLVLTIAAGMGSFYLVLNREYLRQSLNQEKLAHERVFSEKLSADKELNYKNSQVEQLEKANQQLTVYLGNTVATLDEKGSILSQIYTNQAEIKSVQNKLQHIDGSTDAVQQQVSKLTKTVDQLVAKNNQLLKQVNQLAQDNHQLKASNNIITIHKGIGRAFRVEAWRVRSRDLTTRAKKTAKIVLSFEPSDRHEFMKIKKEVFYVTMSDESGAIYNILQGQKKTVYLDNNPVEILPSFELMAEDAEQINRINIAIEDLKGLPAGVYNFDIYTNNAYVGNTQIRLN